MAAGDDLLLTVGAPKRLSGCLSPSRPSGRQTPQTVRTDPPPYRRFTLVPHPGYVEAYLKLSLKKYSPTADL